MKTLLLVLSIYFVFSLSTFACRIAGSDIGECTTPENFDLLIPFCKSVIPYVACLPRYQSHWYNHSALTKDRFIEQMFTKISIQRKILETNTTLLNMDTDEWNGPYGITPRFTDNPDCENAYRNYFCWANFPRCDAEGHSLLLCRSVCENLMASCRLSSNLWRCGEPKYMNAKEPEISTTWEKTRYIYYRAPFPGSPFKDNKNDPTTNKPLIVCTPSLENGATRNSSIMLYIVLSWIGMIQM